MNGVGLIIVAVLIALTTWFVWNITGGGVVNIVLPLILWFGLGLLALFLNR